MKRSRSTITWPKHPQALLFKRKRNSTHGPLLPTSTLVELGEIAAPKLGDYNLSHNIWSFIIDRWGQSRSMGDYQATPAREIGLGALGGTLNRDL